MTFRITAIDNRQEWEQFFFDVCPRALFQSWLWGEVQKKVGGVISRYGIYEGKNLIGIFQTIEVRARRGSFLHVRHGPILKDTSEHVWKEVTNFLKKKTKENYLLFFRISPLLEASQKNHQFFSSLGYKPAAIHAMDAELCWILSLEKDSHILLGEMRKTTRYEIRQAEKLGVVIKESKKIEDLHHFFQLYIETTKRHGFVPHKGIQEEFEVFAKEDQARLYWGEYNGEVVASAIVLFVGDQGIYHHGASKPHSVPASHLIQWKAIQEARSRGEKIYNFWGIADEDNKRHPWRGITLFKKGFGGHEVRYIHAMDYAVSPLYLFSRTVETVRRIRKGY